MTLENLIRLLREIALTIVLAYLGIKLFSGELGLNFSKLSSSELVNLLLAFFSIALSAAFYFAATSQSNQFYDNVNKFSKDTSELLGRLDEQVKNLGGRQTELKDSIDKHYYAGSKGGNAENAKEEITAQAKVAEETLAKLVSEMLDKTNLSAPERASFESKLKEKDAELGALRESIGRAASRLDFRVRNYTRRALKKIGIGNVVDISTDELLFKIAKEGPLAYVRDLVALKFLSDTDISSPAVVTESGKEMLSSIFDKLIEDESDQKS
jgi:hypothetical protein